MRGQAPLVAGACLRGQATRFAVTEGVWEKSVALQTTSKELLRPVLTEGMAWRLVQRVWPRVEPLVRGSAAIVIFLLLWELAPRLGLINRTFLPPFSEVVVKGVQYAAAGKLLPQVLVSVERAAGRLRAWRPNCRPIRRPTRLVSTTRSLSQSPSSAAASDQSRLPVSGLYPVLRNRLRHECRHYLLGGGLADPARHGKRREASGSSACEICAFRRTA